MSVRAKFKVGSITRSMGSTQEACPSVDACPIGSKYHDGLSRHSVPVELQTINLSPVYANNDPLHENSKFWAATPTGSIALGTINAAAASEFEIDGEYYVDFTKADK